MGWIDWGVGGGEDLKWNWLRFICIYSVEFSFNLKCWTNKGSPPAVRICLNHLSMRIHWFAYYMWEPVEHHWRQMDSLRTTLTDSVTKNDDSNWCPKRELKRLLPHEYNQLHLRLNSYRCLGRRLGIRFTSEVIAKERQSKTIFLTCQWLHRQWSEEFVVCIDSDVRWVVAKTIEYITFRSPLPL